MERSVPSGEKRILPFVWHGEDIFTVQVSPVPITYIFALVRRRRLTWITLDPLFLNKVVKLLRPREAIFSADAPVAQLSASLTITCLRVLVSSHSSNHPIVLQN